MYVTLSKNTSIENLYFIWKYTKTAIPENTSAKKELKNGEMIVILGHFLNTTPCLFCLIDTELCGGGDTSNTKSSLQEDYKINFNSN